MNLMPPQKVCAVCLFKTCLPRKEAARLRSLTSDETKHKGVCQQGPENRPRARNCALQYGLRMAWIYVHPGPDQQDSESKSTSPEPHFAGDRFQDTRQVKASPKSEGCSFLMGDTHKHTHTLLLTRGFMLPLALPPTLIY